jgi:CHAT domain-containing protein
VLSLSRAFLAAGARDVIASTWQLYDAAAPQFLDLLYTHLAAGADAPTALATTQRAWLVRTTGDHELDALFSAPLAWAGMSALGAGVAAEARGEEHTHQL